MPKANRTTQALILCASLLLVGCGTTKGPPPELPQVFVPCPSEGQAAILSEPKFPLSESERSQVYTAVAAAIDPLRAQVLIKHWEVEVPSWGRQGWSRVAKMKTWCEARKP